MLTLAITALFATLARHEPTTSGRRSRMVRLTWSEPRRLLEISTRWFNARNWAKPALPKPGSNVGYRVA
jgi:hypothetical protein